MKRPSKPGAAPKHLDHLALKSVRGGDGATYQKIEWTWNDGGITAADDWEKR